MLIINFVLLPKLFIEIQRFTKKFFPLCLLTLFLLLFDDFFFISI